MTQSLVRTEHACLTHGGPVHTAESDQWHYKGWSISADYPPIPYRGADWSATHPDYDASYEGEEDGWVSSGGHVTAATYAELLAEIDAWEAIAEDEAWEETATNGQFGVGA